MYAYPLHYSADEYSNIIYVKVYYTTHVVRLFYNEHNEILKRRGDPLYNFTIVEMQVMNMNLVTYLRCFTFYY